MTTEKLIKPILRETYGKGSMVDSLAKHLAERIETFEERETDFYGDAQRETMIRDVCWHWFSGGSTAASVAKRIEQALVSASTDLAMGQVWEDTYISNVNGKWFVRVMKLNEKSVRVEPCDYDGRWHGYEYQYRVEKDMFRNGRHLLVRDPETVAWEET